MPKPKQRKFSSLGDIEQELGNRTRSLYQQQSATPPLQTLAEMPEPVEQPQPARRKRAPQSIIPRQNGKLLFLEDRHNEAIEEIHWTSKVDRQDVIRAAVDDFITRHFNGERLDAEGEQIVRDYYNRTHV